MKPEIYIKKIIDSTGLTKSKIEELVEKKKDELKGLVSNEGALFIIARDLGVDMKDEYSEIVKDIELNISSISENMKNIEIFGRVREINDNRSFKRDNNEIGQYDKYCSKDKSKKFRIHIDIAHRILNLFETFNIG